MYARGSIGKSHRFQHELVMFVFFCELNDVFVFFEFPQSYHDMLYQNHQFSFKRIMFIQKSPIIDSISILIQT